MSPSRLPSVRPGSSRIAIVAALGGILAGPLASPMVAQDGPAPELPIAMTSIVQEQRSADCVSLGDSRDKVCAILGVPNQWLSVGVWIYWDYRPAVIGDTKDGYDTLAIAFNGDTVTRLRVTKRQAAEQMVTHFQLEARNRPPGDDT